MSTVHWFILVSILISAAAFGFAMWLYRWVKSQPSGNERIAAAGALIPDGILTMTGLVKSANMGPVLPLLPTGMAGPSLQRGRSFGS